MLLRLDRSAAEQRNVSKEVRCESRDGTTGREGSFRSFASCCMTVDCSSDEWLISSAALPIGITVYKFTIYFEVQVHTALVSGIWYLVYCTSPIAYPIVNGSSPSGTWGPRTSTGGLVIVLRARVPPYLYGESVRGRSRHYGNLCVDSALRTCFSHGVVNGSRSVRRRVELGRATQVDDWRCVRRASVVHPCSLLLGSVFHWVLTLGLFRRCVRATRTGLNTGKKVTST